MFEETEKPYIKISGALAILCIGWLITLLSGRPVLNNPAIEYPLGLLCGVLAIIIYTVGKKNDVNKIDDVDEMPPRAKLD